MPKPRTRSTRKPLATDHRALVLESVATNPRATLDAIVADCTGADAAFTANKVGSMVWWLRREGLINLQDGVHHMTKAGLDYLTEARFDRAVPVEHTRPGARKPRKG